LADERVRFRRRKKIRPHFVRRNVDEITRTFVRLEQRVDFLAQLRIVAALGIE